MILALGSGIRYFQLREPTDRSRVTPAERGPGGNSLGATPKQLSAAGCWPPRPHGVDKFSWGGGSLNRPQAT